jgi:quercetin dioxygenase-like cupin family protein
LTTDARGAVVEIFSTIAETPAQRIWEGVTGRARYGQELTLAVVELDPNAFIPEHQHANEQVGLLVSGGVVFRVGEDERTLAPGGSWCIPPNMPHEVRIGPEGAIIIEAFSPPRNDWRALETAGVLTPRWPN